MVASPTAEMQLIGNAFQARLCMLCHDFVHSCDMQASMLTLYRQDSPAAEIRVAVSMPWHALPHPG
jgi:hypothetical protein